MLTRVAIHDSVASSLTEPQVCCMFIRTLEGKVVLALKPDDLRSLCSLLPFHCWQVLKQLIISPSRRVPVLNLAQIDTEQVAHLQPEVIIGDGTAPSEGPGYRTTIHDFTDAPMVRRREQLKQRELSVESCEELWRDVFRPVVESSPPNERTVRVIDEYLFQDFERELKRTGQKSGPASTDEIGLVWLAKKLESVSRRTRAPIELRLITVEQPREGYGAAKIKDLTQQLVRVAGLEFLKLDVWMILAKQRRERPEAFINRQVIINEHFGFRLSKGLDDLTTKYRASDGRVRNYADTAWTWLPNLSSADRRALNSLTELEMETFELA